MELKIIDIIETDHGHISQRFIVLSRRPHFVHDRVGDLLQAYDSGFYSFFSYRGMTESIKAFAGRVFEIPMRGGNNISATGQWWHGVPDEKAKEVTTIGASTIEALGEINVFYSVHVDNNIIKEWLDNNTPSNNYYKYKPTHKDYGKHIVDAEQ